MNLCVFDIGGSSVKYGCLTGGSLVEVGSFKTPQTWEKMRNDLYSVFSEMNEKYVLSGVAFSAPGAVDSKNDIIRGDSAVPYIHGFSIRKELQELFLLPVSIENDANCAALAELDRGAAKDVENAIFVIIGSGIGGAVIVNRALQRGRNLFGGEFGYMLLDEKHSLSNLGSPVEMAKRYALEMGETDIEGSEVFRRADEGEPLAEAHVERLIDALSRGIFNLNCALNPDKIIIGGGLSKRTDLIIRLQEKTEMYLKSKGAEEIDLDIVPCVFRGDANLIGAAVHFMEFKGTVVGSDNSR